MGVIVCPFTKQLSVVRSDKRQKLYYYSAAGKIAPNLPQGQAYLRAQMRPLEQFTVTELAAGAPPEVKPLTQQAAPARPEKPLTQQSENGEPKKASWWEV
ncbi:hypothetical protein [Burkholderia vietnamiensis]|uniref:hypothetical protein n=1 Tax=Burkholderia vietnamiensis TaxID=60552 RepID=UPI00352DF6C1